MLTTDPFFLCRDCEVIEIPNGVRCHLEAGTRVRMVQARTRGYTIATDHGLRYRVDEREADALELSMRTTEETSRFEALGEEQIRKQLKTVFDPEIPVNIVDLGLIYSAKVASLAGGGKKVEIKMSMTSPGCGMANVLKTDVESKLLLLPMVKEVHVEVIFDPPWSPSMMTEEAKLELGFDLDYGRMPSNTSAFRIIR